MPIFARRRLQAMLDDRGPRLTSGRAKDLVNRLESEKKTDQVLPAEFELGLLWAIAQVSHLTAYPELPGATPEGLSDDLFPSGRAFIEITALSDDTFSGEKDMNRAANKIAQFADRVRKGAGKELFFEFDAPGYFRGGRYHRDRHVDAFELTPAFESMLRTWLSAPDWPNPTAIRLKAERVSVLVRWKQGVHPLFRVFSPVLPIAYDLEDNPLFKRLQLKERQLSSTPAGTLKCVFVGDAGCLMLRELRSHDPTRLAKNGDEIIRHFLARSSIDIVCVFSPTRRPGLSFNPLRGSPIWGVHVYDRREVWSDDEHSKLQALAAALPAPRLEGYRARSLLRQGMFRPQARGWYARTSTLWTGPMSKTPIKVSARRLQELLAGRITLQQFEQREFGVGMLNRFDSELERGLTIQDARVEKAGLDEDDDILVFDLGPDPAALPLKKPTTSR